MPPRSKPNPVYEPEPDAPRHVKLRWIDDLRFEVVSDDPEPEYIDTDDLRSSWLIYKFQFSTGGAWITHANDPPDWT